MMNLKNKVQASNRVLSGIRATGRLHLGNYLGAVKGFLELQEDKRYETFYMVADAHSVTTPFDIENLRRNRREVILDYLAAGLDPERSVIFQQAENPHHFELAFYFSAVTTMAKMQHLPTFKEKVKQHPQNVTMALLNYPVLMAADILVYKAGLVPVGIDQEPHLEVAREIARAMNQQYGMDFPEPVRFATKGEYVPSLAGEGKMSKSVEGSYITLTDDLETIKQRLAGAPTDSGKGKVVVKGAEAGKIATASSQQRSKEYVDQSGKISAGVASLLQFVELFQGVDRRAEYEAAYQGSGLRYRDLKEELAQAIFAELQPLQQRRQQLEQDKQRVDAIIADGAARARKVAGQTVLEVREKMGLA